MPESLREELLEEYDMLYGCEAADATDYAFTFAIGNIDYETAEEIKEFLRAEYGAVGIESAAIK